ncbi:MAG: hypothetical protein AAF513_03920 [Pseudomonadota bacterium]
MSMNWRIQLGLGLTIVWIGLGVSYIASNIGWGQFAIMPAEEMGNFLEGAFAPLAFLWLVIGYFLQQKELEQNTQALQAQAIEIRRTAEQAAIQTENLAASELHARQEAFLQVAQSVRQQLGSIAGLLYISSQSRGNGGTADNNEVSRLFGAQGSGIDVEAFSRRLLELNLQTEDPQACFELFYGTEIRARHSNNFAFTFERMLRRAAQVDSENMIQDALGASGHGFLYRVIKRHQANAPEAWSDHTKTGTHINF